MGAEHAIGRPIDNELHQGLLTPAGKGVFKRRKVAFVDSNSIEVFASGGLGQAHCPDIRVAEDSRGDEVIVELLRQAAKLGQGKCPRLGKCHRRQFDPIGHVTNSIEAGYRTPVIRIDADCTFISEPYPNRFKPEPAYPGDTPDGIENEIGLELLAIIHEHDRHTASVLLYCLNVGIELKFNAFFSQLLG